ncbi:MAG: ATP-binding protein [Solirubrobacteraceae bacterium]
MRLQIESRPQSLTIVRGMLSGAAEFLSLDPELLDDLKTAVSEACNNVVQHAYGGGPGPMDVRFAATDGLIRVVVEDRGVGLPAVQPESELPQGIGLPVIRALTARVTIADRAAGGTEVVMDFDGRRDGRGPFAPPPPGPDTEPELTADGADVVVSDGADVVVSLSPVTLLAGVLGRLVRTLAASAHFSLDRLSDVHLITETLAADAGAAAAAERIGARLGARDRRLELTVGPFRRGTGSRLAMPGPQHAASPFVLLCDEVSVVPDGDAEVVRVVVIDHRR